MDTVLQTSGIINMERPQPGLRDMERAGAAEIMLDFGMYAHLYEYGGEKWRPERYRREFQLLRDSLQAGGNLRATVAKTPFLSPGGKVKMEKPEEWLLAANRECIKAAEELGISFLIVQPLFWNIGGDGVWEKNRSYFLKLAKACEKPDTKLLLINGCKNRGGHLVRGLCADGVTAAQWVDELNRAAGMERFGFCMDTGIGNICGQNMQDFIAELGARIKAVLLSENGGNDDERRLPFTNARWGRSVMDWTGIIRGLRDIGFDGKLILDGADTVGAFSPLLKPQILAVAKAELDYFSMQIGIENDLKKYKKIVLFGAGNMCRNYMKCYGEKYPPLFTCDNNPKLWGTAFEGLTIHNPEDLRKLPPDCGVIVCNMYYREIAAQLAELGVKNIGYFNDEYMPSFYVDRLERGE